MKKILLYTDTPQTGGAELQMFLLAKFLNKENFTPVLACSKYPKLDNWCKKFEREGIQVMRLDVRHKHDPKHYFLLKKIIKEEEIDLLHAHVWNPASCRYAFYAASGIPIVTTEHDPFRLSYLKDFFKKKTLKKVAHVITVSENNKKIIDALYPNHSKKFSVIHNGIDTIWWQSQLLRFSDQDYKKIKRELFHAHENSLIITTIAELHERKGVKFLIKSIPEVVEKYPNVKFVIIGEGSEKGNLENLVKKFKLNRHVALLGRQKNIPHLLKSSDIFVLTSKREAFGLVNLEAMITPLPVVATNVGGIPEVVVHEKTGLVVEPENPHAIAEALKKLIGNNDLRTTMAKSGKERVLKYFDARVVAEKYEKIYENLIKI